MGTKALVGHGSSIYNYVRITDALIFKQRRAHSFSRGETISGLALGDIQPFACPNSLPNSHVKLMNYRSDSDTKLEIYLNNICIASRHFELRKVLGQVDARDLSQHLLASVGTSDSGLSLKIGWQERVTLHYLVIPIEVNRTSVSFSTLSFSSGDEMALGSQLLIDHRYGAQVTDFICLERAHEVFTVSQCLVMLTASQRSLTDYTQLVLA
jgi:hypothetical protein